MKTYLVNEVFYSLQGEGLRAGTANVFVRFAGCDLQCSMMPGPLSPGGFDCDTNFSGGRKLTAEALLEQMAARGGPCRNVILTGGEPMLQVDGELLASMRGRGWFIALETNGNHEVGRDWFDWVTVSPKVAEHTIKALEADEVKYVIHHGQAIPKPRVKATNKLISPAWDPARGFTDSLAWCIQLIKENPEWRLSMQQHKLWNVR